MVRLEHEIAISGLPDQGQIIQWIAERYSRWTSVCDVSVADLLNEDAVSEFQGQVFKLSDPFSKSPAASSDFQPSQRLFLESSDALTRSVLLKAVRWVADNYRQGEKQIVFCHLGKSRSPLVSVAAICVCHGYESRDVWDHYVRFFGADPATELGLSAIEWIKRNCKI